MASYSVDVNTGSKGVRNKLLTANVQDVVTINTRAGSVEVMSMDGACPIYITVDGDPSLIEGEKTQVMPAAIGTVKISTPGSSFDPTVVRLIAPANTRYSLTWSV